MCRRWRCTALKRVGGRHNETMNVLLFSANRLTAPYPVYPIGLDYVAAAVAPRHQVERVDLAQVQDPEEIRRKVVEHSPDVVGIAIRNIDNTDATETVSFIDEYRELTRLVRGATRAKVVLGGSGFTIAPAELMDALDADYGIVGEGERLGPLLDSLERGQEVSGLPGVVLPERAVSVPPPWEGAIDRAFSSDDPMVPFYLRKSGMLNLQTKRGCPFSCTYCTYPLIEGKTVRLFDPEEVAHTARMLQEAGARFLFVTDAVFNSDFEHGLLVARAMRRVGVDVPWGAYFAPRPGPQGYWQGLADAGLTHVEFGTDSLSPKMLASYRKPFRKEDVLAAHEAALAAGVNVAHFFLVGGPGEDETTVDETVQTAATLPSCVCFFFCGVRVFPSTELYGLAVKEGQISARADPLEPVFYSPAALPGRKLAELTSRHLEGRSNWLAGGGGERLAGILGRLYNLGHTGPLWEKLIQ